MDYIKLEEYIKVIIIVLWSFIIFCSFLMVILCAYAIWLKNTVPRKKVIDI